jgi:Tfp pilus assembly protein PilE
LTAIASAFSTISGLATMAALMAVLFAVYQSYKMYVGRAEQTQPKAMTMAMAAGR